MGQFYHEDGRPVQVGDKVTSFRGEEMTVFGMVPPRDNSTGRIYTTEGGAGFYPSVFKLTWKE